MSRIGVVKIDRLNVRPEPTNDKLPVAEVRIGERVSILGEAEGWYLIEVDSGLGYVHGDFLEVMSAGDLKPGKKTIQLEEFRGSLEWIRQWEGHVGKPYWPGGASGVTLDPGVDLGRAAPGLVCEAYRPLLAPEQLEALKRVVGVRGVLAREALKSDPVLQSVEVSRESAHELFPLCARPHWDDCRRRFSGLDAAGVPSDVHTAVLSLAYNRGPHNPGLEVLVGPIRDKDWQALGEAIAAMQQDHPMVGVRRRRRAEGALILVALA